MKLAHVMRCIALASTFAGATASVAASRTFANDGSLYGLANGLSYGINAGTTSGLLSLSNTATAQDPTQPYYSGENNTVVGAYESFLPITPSGVAGGQVISGTTPYIDINDGLEWIADTISVTSPVGSMTADVGDLSQVRLLNVLLSGGLTQTMAKTGAGSGGSITFRNLNIDVANKVIYADVSGSGLVGGNMPVFTFTTVVGSTVADFSTLAAGSSLVFNNSFEHLAMSTGAQAAMIQALGLNATIGQPVLRILADWGYLQTQVAVRAVPEPSSSVLAGLGMSCALVLARRLAKV